MNSFFVLKSWLGQRPWLGLLLLVAVAITLRSGCSSRLAPVVGSGPIAVGTPLPMLQVAGWLNTDAPLSTDSLRGRVVVIDCWATWCPPCRAEMPHLAEIATRYQPLGVTFIGLTPEPAAKAAEIAAFIKTVDRFDWPVGYEAGLPIEQLSAPGFPTLIVFGSDGRAVWSAHSSGGLAAALDKALAR